jgi:hypothetical protein
MMKSGLRAERIAVTPICRSHAAYAFVQKFDPAAGADDAIDALRAAKKQFADIRRRTQQIEKLAGRDSERLGRSFNDEVLVFRVDPVVGDNRAKRFFGRDVRWRADGLALADDVRRGRKWLTVHQAKSCLSVKSC